MSKTLRTKAVRSTRPGDPQRTEGDLAFLRFAYGRYLSIMRDRAPRGAYSHGKIAGSLGLPVDGEDAAKLALSRWSETSQRLPWRNRERSDDLLDRLEAAVRKEPEIDKMFYDRRLREREMEALTGLTRFFLPAMEAKRDEAIAALKPFEGLFEGTYLSPRTWDNSDGGNPIVERVFCRIHMDERYPLLRVEEFVSVPQASDGNAFVQRRMGIAFVARHRRVMRAMTSLDAPSDRWVELLIPVTFTPLIEWFTDDMGPEKGDLQYEIELVTLSGQKTIGDDIGHSMPPHALLMQRLTGRAEEAVLQHFNSGLWNFPL